MFIVYLIVDFLQLPIDDMKTLLNTHTPAPYPLWQRIILKVSANFSAGLILLLLVGFTSQVLAAPGFSSNSVIIASTPGTGGSGNVNGTYYTNVAGTPKFTTVPNLGTFDRNPGTSNGTLTLGAESNTTESGNENVTSVRVFYRVYSTAPGTVVPAFSVNSPSILLQQANGTNKTRQWTSVSPVNLLGATTGPGTYRLDFFFQLTYSDNRNTGVLINDTNGSNNSFYSSTFTVKAADPALWKGFNTTWSDTRNWSTGKEPDSNTDVTIPKTGIINFPSITRISRVRTLTILGNNANDKATVSIDEGGELQVFGDFKDPNGGLLQNAGVFTLAGVNQTFDGGRFFEVHIQGGGVKTLTSILTIFGSNGILEFLSGTGIGPDGNPIINSAGGVISTNIDNVNSYGVNLNGNAKIYGEDENSYVLGILNANRTVNSFNDFGRMGVELTIPISGTSIVATRLTGIINSGVGLKGASIKRSFSFIGNTPDNINYTLAFHYLDNELNMNNPANLEIYTLPNTATTFTKLGKSSSSVSAKTVTLSQITSPLQATFTLAEAAPLPVTLVSFTATATAQGTALLRWVTAVESNNRGFGIERQLGTDEAWQSVGFVAAGATTGSAYEHTDKSLAAAPASSKAYYRLRQEDLDGKVSYSPVAVISRSAALAATELTLSPVPLTSGNLSVGLAEAGQAGILVAVTNTQGQRVLNFTSQASTDAALSLPVTNLAAGVYIVTVQVPGQAVRHARFVKL